MKNRPSLLLWVVAILSAIITLFAIRTLAPSGSPASYEAQLVDAANQLNAKGPQVLDSSTRLEKVQAGPGNRFTYHYTLTQLSSADPAVEEWKAKALPRIRVQMKSAALEPMFKQGTTVVYRYSGKDGGFIDEVIVTPQEGITK